MNMHATRSAGLVRSRSDRKLGGVAGGLAITAGLDPTLVRVAMAVGAFTGWGILVYLIAWAVIPEEDEDSGRVAGPAPEPVGRRLRIGLAIVAGLGALQVAGTLAAIAFATLGTVGAIFDPFIDPFAGDFGGFNPDFPVRGMIGLILLGGGGFYLLRRRNRPEPAPRGEDMPPTFGRPTSQAVVPGYAAPPPPPPDVSVPAGEGRNWRSAGEWFLLAVRAMGWMVALWFVAAGAVLTGLWAFDALRLRLPFLLAVVALAALGVMGTVLVRSRRPAMILSSSAALLVPVVLTLFLARWNGVVGYRAVNPTSVDEIPTVYRHAAGELRVDLTNLTFPPGVTEVRIEMGAGEVEVRVPDDVTIDASAKVGMGEFNILGRSQAGLSLEGEARDAGPEGSPTLRLIGRTSAGQFKVFQDEEPPRPPLDEVEPPAEPAPPAMPPGSYVCDFPPDGAPANCRPA
jgi:phage shock protein PspC (stress-responsive transcriptional regulator)/predicted membrane protein